MLFLMIQEVIKNGEIDFGVFTAYKWSFSTISRKFTWG